MTLETYIRAQVARFCVEEGAQYGGIQNMLAVAHVLRNRVYAGWGGWLEVLDSSQAKRGTLFTPPAPDLRGGSIRTFLARLDDVYSKPSEADLTGGALFYINPANPIEPWFQTQIIGYPEDHPRVAHVGPVFFYK